MVDAAPGREAFPEGPATIQASNLRPLSGESIQALFALVATTGKCAEEAHRRLGRTPERHIIRGGTDGSRLTELGLPSPNLSSGQHNPHSPLEWACLDEMAAAVEVLIELVQVWAEKG